MHGQEEILVCTTCSHIVSSNVTLNGGVYSHPDLQVLLCKRCYNRISNTSDSDKLCRWCHYPGKFVVCTKCSSTFCMKCIKNNLDESTSSAAIKKKSWTGFCCEPDLLAEHRAKCARALQSTISQPVQFNMNAKRSNSESPPEPKKRYRFSKGFDLTSHDVVQNNFLNENHRKMPSANDYAAKREEIIKKTEKIRLLFLEVTQKTYKFDHKFKTRKCNLEELQKAFTFKNNLIDATIKTLEIWKEEILNIENNWKREYGISLILPESSENRECEEDVEVDEIHKSKSSKEKKCKKKFNLSLKRTDTDDDLIECNEEENLDISEVNSKQNDLECVNETHLNATVQNCVPAITETLNTALEQPETDDDNASNHSVFSQATLVINQNDLLCDSFTKEDIVIKTEFDCYNDEGTSLSTMTLCETTGYFIGGSVDCEGNHNIKVCSNSDPEDDTSSESSFVFDLNGCTSPCSPNDEADDSDATIMFDYDLPNYEENSRPISVVSDTNDNCTKTDSSITNESNEVASNHDLPQVELSDINQVDNIEENCDKNDLDKIETTHDVTPNETTKVDIVTANDDINQECDSRSDNGNSEVEQTLELGELANTDKTGNCCSKSLNDSIKDISEGDVTTELDEVKGNSNLEIENENHDVAPDTIIREDAESPTTEDWDSLIVSQDNEVNDDLKEVHTKPHNDNIEAIDEQINSLEPTDSCLSNQTEANGLSQTNDIQGSLITNPDDELSDLPYGKTKVEFFESLGLQTNDICNEIEEKDTQESIERAVNMLKQNDDDLFDSDVDSIESSSSEMEHASEENENSDLENKHFSIPSTSTAAIVNEETLLETIGNDSIDVDRENEIKTHLLTEYKIKPCTVVLERLEDASMKALNTYTVPRSVCGYELKEIDRLINLKNLELKRKAEGSLKKAKRLKRQKIMKPSGSPGSRSETDDSDIDLDDICEGLRTPSPVAGPMSDISNEGMLDAIININGPFSDFDIDTSDKDSDCNEEGDKQVSKKKKKRQGSVDSNKENLPDNEDVEKTVPKELTEEERALAEKRKWRNDPLLRGNFSESDSDVESDDVEGENILSKKTREKMEKLEKNRDNNAKVKRRKSNSVKENSDNETDKDLSLSSESEGDVDDGKINQIIINTDTDSDIEFISESKKKTPVKKLAKICISSDEDFNVKDEIDDDDDDENELGNKKKGRRNIRAILSDETLEEATKRANLIEKQRKDRLTQKHRNMDNLLSQSSFASQEEGLILDVDEETESPLIVVHSNLTKRLKNHQQVGVRFMWESCYEGVKQLKKDAGSGCILAHCMGLGKTFQVVTLIHTLFAHPITKTKHVLIVCPLSIVLNWENEFKKGLESVNDGTTINIFCISERFHSLTHRLFVVEKWQKQTGVLIMGYEAYQRLTKFKNCEATSQKEQNIKKTLLDPGPDLVVLDEGHLLKNGKNCRTQALMKVKTKRRIILTGTPLQNNLKEYYHMVQFVKPNLLGSYHEYTNRFVNPITNGQYDDSTEEDIRQMKRRSHVLHKLLKGSIQRYEVSELRSYLPQKYDYVLFVQLHLAQATLYEKYVDLIKQGEELHKGTLFSHYHNLQVIWTHPCLLYLKDKQKKSKKKEVDVINLDPEINEDDVSPLGWWHSLCPSDYKTNIDYGPKLKVMLSIIQECEKVDDKVLVFSSSLPELDAIEVFLQQHATRTSPWKPKEDYYRMDGSVLPDTRLQLCNSFNDSNNKKARVFLISHRVGGLGLNLVAANRVILMDVSWNPAYDSQSVFRTYRFGQEKECYVYRLVSMGTMEEVVYQRQVHKLATAGRVVDEMQITRHYRSDDLQKMYRLNFKMDQERPSFNIPVDRVLATILQSCKEIFKYHEHQALLENKPEEELNEDEMKIAWEEFNKENENRNLMIEQQKKKMLLLQLQPQPLGGPNRTNNFLPGLNAVNNFSAIQNKTNNFLPGPSGVNLLPGQNKTNNTLSGENGNNNFSPGPSGANNFLPRPTTTKLVKVSLNKNSTTNIPFGIVSAAGNALNTTTKNTKVSNVPNRKTQAQPEPRFEAVFVPDNNKQIFNAEESSSRIQQQNYNGQTAKSEFQTELKKKFYNYFQQTTNRAEASTINGSVTTPSAVVSNQLKSTHVINSAQPQKNTKIVMPQIVNSYSEQSPSVVKTQTNIRNVTATTKNAIEAKVKKIVSQPKEKVNFKKQIEDIFISTNSSSGSISKKSLAVEQQELLNSLNKNLDITLSVRDKPHVDSNSIIDLSKDETRSAVNTAGNQISISTVRKSVIQPNRDGVIEID